MNTTSHCRTSGLPTCSPPSGGPAHGRPLECSRAAASGLPRLGGWRRGRLGVRGCERVVPTRIDGSVWCEGPRGSGRPEGTSRKQFGRPGQGVCFVRSRSKAQRKPSQARRGSAPARERSSPSGTMRQASSKGATATIDNEDHGETVAYNPARMRSPPTSFPSPGLSARAAASRSTFALVTATYANRRLRSSAARPLSTSASQPSAPSRVAYFVASPCQRPAWSGILPAPPRGAFRSAPSLPSPACCIPESSHPAEPSYAACCATPCHEIA